MVREEACFMPTVGSVTPWTLLTLASHLRNEGHEVRLVDAQLDSLNHQELVDIVAAENPDEIITISTLGYLVEDTEYLSSLSDISLACIVYPPYETEEIKKQTPWIDEVVFDWIRYYGVREVPNPSYDLVKPSRYYRVVSQSSLHCPFRCIFCTVAQTGWIARKPMNVISELKELEQRGVRFVRFLDPDFTLNKQRVEQICSIYKEEKVRIKWAMDARISDITENMLTNLREANCVAITYGIESGSQQVLDEIDKGYDTGQIKNVVKTTERRGIAATPTFCFGFPSDSLETYEETCTIINEIKPLKISVGFPRPYPNTKLYRIGTKENLLSHSDVFSYQKDNRPLMRTRYLETNVIDRLVRRLQKKAKMKKFTLKYLVYRLKGRL
ncbi:MAG: radical SAM protein [Candidatus Bathyarchaeia archaeon]